MEHSVISLELDTGNHGSDVKEMERRWHVA
jgi:hypothetical protein